jgi:hypothetical protein
MDKGNDKKFNIVRNALEFCEEYLKENKAVRLASGIYF